MGSSGGKYGPIGSAKKDGNTLVEVTVGDITHAHEVIGMKPETYTPVVIVPEQSAFQCCCIPCCCVSIPHGFYTIVTKWGRDMPGAEPDTTWSPGCHCFLPWWRVARLVSQQLIVFDTPVKQVKTQDNITISLDVLIVFEVKEPRKFSYGLGADGLDGLLRASQEEVLRALAVKTPVEEIYDMHGTDTDDFVAKMNEEFDQYGIFIHFFTVRNVDMPADMAKDFEDKTLYEALTEEGKVKQTLDRMKLNNTEAKQKLSDECENLSMKEEEQNVTARAHLQKETAEMEATVTKEIDIFNAQRDADVMDLLATTELEIVKTKCESMRLKAENEAKVNNELDVLVADAEAFRQKTIAEGMMESAQRKAAARRELALAEGAATPSFAAMRRQEQELKRLDILSKLARNPNIKVVTSMENNMGLAPDNSLVAQVTQQGLEAFRMKLAEVTKSSTKSLQMNSTVAGGLVRPMPQQEMLT